VTLVLADTSVWVREHQAHVAAMMAVALRGNRLAMVLPVALELLRSAPTARRLRQEAKRLDALHQIVISANVERRAREIQDVLAERGYHRAASPTDLVAAAAAESVEAELWHCDRHFELIAAVTGQPMRRLGE
jgi:predicted nucleic acid-binding protein